MIRPPAKPAATKNRTHLKPDLNPNTKICNPLKDLNAIVPPKTRSTTRHTTTTTSTNSKSSSFSSSSSYRNPRNHLHHQQQQLKLSDVNSRNPGNVTSDKIRSKSSKPLDAGRKIGERSADPMICRLRAGNKLSSRICQEEKKKVASLSDSKDQLFGNKLKSGKLEGKNDRDFEFTPVGFKAVNINCGENGDGSSNTPPAEVTVSPEIQCGSNVMSAATPVCFGAGHVLSGVSDKRKCRPRGMLVVGDNCKGIDGLSISNEDLVSIGDVDDDLVPFLPVEASMHWLLSPDAELLFSPCSGGTSGSENVIQTPESYTSLERHMSLPWFHGGDESSLDFVDGQEETSYSSGLTSEHIDSSFEFNCHLKPTNSLEFNQLQYNSSWISDANLENERRSHLRISWRDGVTDNEVKTDLHSLNPRSSESKLPDNSTASFMKIFDVKSAGSLNGNENSTIQKDITCAESISLDAGSLAASGDSDWDMCYNNNLFHIES